MLLIASTPLQRGAWSLFNIILIAGLALGVLVVVGFFLWLGVSSIRGGIDKTNKLQHLRWFGIPAFLTALFTVGSGVNLGIAAFASLGMGVIVWVIGMFRRNNTIDDGVD